MALTSLTPYDLCVHRGVAILRVQARASVIVTSYSAPRTSLKLAFLSGHRYEKYFIRNLFIKKFSRKIKIKKLQLPPRDSESRDFRPPSPPPQRGWSWGGERARPQVRCADMALFARPCRVPGVRSLASHRCLFGRRLRIGARMY
jgi:hypothetical protein